jgi:small conductance mechanosensitive channel
MKTRFILACAVFSVLGWNLAQAQSVTNAESNPAITIADPNIPIGHLDLLLDPLTKDELIVEVKGWRNLVKAKVQKISAAEIATREKTKVIAAVEAEAEAKAETNVEAKAGTSAPATEAAQQHQEQKEEILENLTKLREERSALLERLKTVLDAYEAKGGDPTEYRQYAKAVTGINVEVTDTGATWAAIRGWIMSKEGGIKLGIRMLGLLGIMLAFWIVAWVVGVMVRKATARNERMSDLLRRFLNKTVQRLILFIGLLVALSTQGVQIEALLALVGGSAFIIGFALQDTLGNFAAGMMLLVYRPFDVGDSVEAGGVSGKVDNVSLVSTTIRTFDNKVVLVPNKQVWGQIITNITGAKERRVDMMFAISHSADADTAKAILEKVVAGHPLVLKEPSPTIELHELGESSVKFICRPWAKTPDLDRVYWDITMRVKKELAAGGITIPIPQRDVHIHPVPAESLASLTAQPSEKRRA